MVENLLSAEVYSGNTCRRGAFAAELLSRLTVITGREPGLVVRLPGLSLLSRAARVPLSRLSCAALRAGA